MVFQSLANLTDVFALARASRLFKDIWQFNAASICDAILPCAIECFEDARTLTEAQAHNEKDDIAKQDKNRVALQRAKRYLSNQDTVHRTCNRFEREILRKLAPRIDKGTPVLTPTERPRFIHAYYQLWIHILRKSSDGWLKPPRASVSTFSKRERVLKSERRILKSERGAQKSEMMVWLYHRERASRAPITPNTVGKHWQGDGDMMRKHGQELNRTFFADIISRPSQTLPLLYTVMDDFQDFLESNLSMIASNHTRFLRFHGPP